MYLLSRKKLLGGLVGLLLAGSVIAPAAAARVAATVSITVPNEVHAATEGWTAGKCAVPVDITWDATAINGPSVTVNLEVSADGGTTWGPAGTRVRYEDTGSAQFLKQVDPGSYSYRVSLTKGPKHIVASGTSNSVTCLPIAAS